MTTDDQNTSNTPTAKAFPSSSGYKYTVRNYVITGLIIMQKNFKSQEKYSCEVDDLEDLISRMFEGENILL